MSENKKCPQFLGIHVAERVLAQAFKQVERMPLHNHGYDFVCGKGHWVDVKSSCRRHNGKIDNWQFQIEKNQIAEYFLLLAFDNRDDLIPEHIWLIPGVILMITRLFGYLKQKHQSGININLISLK